MRVLAIAIFALLAAGGQPAAAAGWLPWSAGASTGGCSKGMLWPYVRNPGDCLTDEEVRFGQRGVYNGPVNTNPDVGAIPSQMPTQSGAITPQAPGAAQASLPGNAVQEIAPGTTEGGVLYCNKGPFWPFVKNPGDCPSQNVTLRNGKPVAPPPVKTASLASLQSNTVTPASPAAAITAPAGGSAAIPAAAAECHKGAFWPFVRKPGDCPTNAEKAAAQKAGQ